MPPLRITHFEPKITSASVKASQRRWLMAIAMATAATNAAWGL